MSYYNESLLQNPLLMRQPVDARMWTAYMREMAAYTLNYIDAFNAANATIPIGVVGDDGISAGGPPRTELTAGESSAWELTSGATRGLSFNMKIPDPIVQDSDRLEMFFTMAYMNETAAGGADTATKWEIEVLELNVGDTGSAATTVTGTSTVTASVAAETLFEAEVGPFDINKGYWQGTVIRLGADAADTYTGDVFLLNLGARLQVKSGS